MLVSRIFALVAASVSMVNAQGQGSTITMTSTLTQLLTITRCDPAFTACPGSNSASSTAHYPISNSTTTSVCTKCAAPTNNTTLPPPIVTIKTTASVNAPSPAPPASTSGTVVSGASALFLQSGVLLGAVGAGIALLA